MKDLGTFLGISIFIAVLFLCGEHACTYTATNSKPSKNLDRASLIEQIINR